MSDIKGYFWISKQWISSVRNSIWGKFPNPLFIEMKGEIFMATTKLWKVESRIDNAVNYVTNKEKTKNEYYDYGMDKYETVRDVLRYATNSSKTEKQFYVSGINCKAENAVKEMQMEKQIYGKENGILAFHGEQSFKEWEVTPELAHEIGVRLAEEMCEDRFQVIVTTHLNTKSYS